MTLIRCQLMNIIILFSHPASNDRCRSCSPQGPSLSKIFSTYGFWIKRFCFWGKSGQTKKNLNDLMMNKQRIFSKQQLTLNCVELKLGEVHINCTSVFLRPLTKWSASGLRFRPKPFPLQWVNVARPRSSAGSHLSTHCCSFGFCYVRMFQMIWFSHSMCIATVASVWNTQVLFQLV